MAGEDKRHFRNEIISFTCADIRLRVRRPTDLLGNRFLELRLALENGFDGALYQIQALAKVLNGRFGHFPGDFL